jgi:hypothetical protein
MTSTDHTASGRWQYCSCWSFDPVMNLLNCNHLARIRSLSSELWSAIGTEDNILTNAVILLRFDNRTPHVKFGKKKVTMARRIKDAGTHMG